ncbi:AI-2E family transporter [Tsuneonella sp. HG222]
MSDTAADPPIEKVIAEDNVGNNPTQITDPKLRYEASKALVWATVIGLVVLSIYIAQSLMVIFGAMVFACMLDGGARLLGRVLPIGRGWRMTIVLLLSVAFLAWLFYFAGSQISQQAAQFPALAGEQLGRIFAWMQSKGFAVGEDDIRNLVNNLFSGVGTVTKAIGGIFGGLTTLFLIAIIGIYLAIDPRAYERGLAWMVPGHRRAELADTVGHMAFTMRRLLAGRLAGMAFEGLFTWVMLMGWGLYSGTPVPMAALLALLTGLLAFIPNIGAIISGALMVLVGFSGGTEMGLYTIFVYFLVQNIDGYILVPMIAKKTVDLAPALVLMSQLIFGVLFGILGLALADPMLAMIKVALERRADRLKKEGAAD